MVEGVVRVKLTVDSWDPVLRQTPGGAGRWRNFHFLTDPRVTDCDYWVVCERLAKTEVARCPPESTLLVTWEPPAIHTYHGPFLRQFAAVLSPHRGLPHPRIFLQQPAIAWHSGLAEGETSRRPRLGYDDFKAVIEFPKIKLMSAVVSSKTTTEGHRQRLRLLERLKAEFGESLDVFGKGLRKIEDKWDAIYPYRYHLALENSSHPDYWSEKLADAYLGGAFPLYWGCPNVADYFPDGSYRTIDLADINGAVATIRAAVAADEYSGALPLIHEARQRVLDRYNLFPTLADVLPTLPASSRPRRVRLRPEADFALSLPRRLKRRLKPYFVWVGR